MNNTKSKTDTEYVANNERCPFCDSDQIKGYNTDFGVNFIYHEVACLDCNKIWEDTYQLIGYREKE